MKLSLFRFYIFVIIVIAQVCYSEIHQNTNSIDANLTAQIDNFITKHYLPNTGITGLGISIVRITDDGQALYSNGYGMADQKKEIRNGNQTQFLIGSVTKSFTSAVVVKILNEKFPEMGEAVLDTPIRTLIPAANFTLPDRFRSEHGTFRDLLAHRMCLKGGDIQTTAESFNRSELIYRQRYAEEICGIRSGFQYNNEMFVMAGELIGILANKSFETLAEDLLTEIGMHNSTFGKKSDNYSSLPYRARPYDIKDNVSHPLNTDVLKRTVVENAACGLWSTPEDMAKYLAFHLNLGYVGEKEVIPESVMKWLDTPSNLLPSGWNAFKSSEDDKFVNLFSYGLGLFRGTYDGWEYLQHAGYVPPFGSLLSLFPSQNIGIFTTKNQSPANVDQQVLHKHIFEIFRGSENALVEGIKLIERKKEQEAEEKINDDKNIEKFLGQVEDDVTCPQKEMSILANITGRYASGFLGDLEVLEKFNPKTNTTNGQYLSYGKWGHGWLKSYNGCNNNDIDTNTTQLVNLKIIWETDILQGDSYARVYNKTFEFVWPGEDEPTSYGKFRMGINLGKLSEIPWNPNSC